MGAGRTVKIEGWERKLSAYLLETAVKPFQYGTLDCVCFACDWVNLAVNIDPMLEGRGKYNNLRDGAMLIKNMRGEYEGIMDHYFNRIPLKQAQRGDIALTRGLDATPAYGIINDGKAFFKAQGVGLSVLPLTSCTIAWRVE